MAPARTPHPGCREWAITAYSYRDRSDALEAALPAQEWEKVQTDTVTIVETA